MSTKYAISWLYGEFTIGRFKRGKLVESYRAEHPVESQSDFVRALTDARESIDMRSRGDVAVVHEHDLHQHVLLEIPRMARRDLEKYLLRRVLEDASFDGEASWCYHEVNHRDGSEGVLLHLLPKRIVDTTTVTCTAMGLLPKRYVPLTEIISDFSETLDLSQDAIYAFVALFNERTEIVISRGDGEVLFVRELSYGLAEDVERLAVDINRTLRYTKQQLGESVGSVRLLGTVSEAAKSVLTQHIDGDVESVEASNSPTFWLERVASLSGKLSANFISALAQRNITSDSLRRMGVWLTGLLVFGAGLVTAGVTGYVSDVERSLGGVTARNVALEGQIGELSAEVARLRGKQDHLARLTEGTPQLPTLFLVHLSRLVPEHVTLNEVDVAPDGSGWTVTVRGVVQGDIDSAAATLAALENELAGSPWLLNITRSWKESWMEQLRSGDVNQIAPVGFEIEGALR